MHICLSLGHNSSAVLLRKGQRPIGYEEERLTKKKSDSAFPERSIDEIFKFADVHSDQVETVYISHWFDVFDPQSTENKYYSAKKVRSLFPNALFVDTRIDGLTHHDAHALSALAFSNHYDERTSTNKLIAVIDGFGNRGEVASVYKVVDGMPRLVHRVTGYGNSLGLLYQYAATAVGMDGMNDVYKFLGYRVHITPEEIERCDMLADQITAKFLVAYMRKWSNEPSALSDGLIDYGKLDRVRESFENYFLPVIDNDAFRSRIRVGYVVQKVLEDVVIKYINRFSFDTLLVAGGCFYNVRLNDVLRRKFRKATFCVMPLAGDQGAAMGLAFADHPWVKDSYSDLFWGKRVLSINALEPTDAIASQIADKIAAGEIINLLQGDMEFGPRSLCNTASLALCRTDLIDSINTANGRTTVMPCAPVMLMSNAIDLFSAKDLARTKGSDRFMITAHNYLPGISTDELGGAMHRDVDGSHSGRPQLVFDETSFIGRILTILYQRHGVRAIVNTSLNIHGSPIIHDCADLAYLTKHWLETSDVKFSNYVVR